MSEIRVAAIHQPNFLPWLGFFHKMVSADIFILLDNVPYSKNSYQNRVKIKSAQGEQWLTVPVLTKGRFGQLTCDVPINNAGRWQNRHLAALRTNYQRAPCFEQVLTWLEPFYRKTYAKLADFNRALIEAVVHQLKLPVSLVDASSLASDGSGAGLLLQLVQAVGCDVYLSGPSGRDYLDMSIFQQSGVEVRFQQFQHPFYPQLYDDFIPGLSIVDLLMNVNSHAAVDCLKGCSDPLHDAKEKHD